MKGLDAHTQGDFNMNNPARLLDCPNCDGTYWPEDEKCSFCGYDLQKKPSVSEVRKN